MENLKPSDAKTYDGSPHYFFNLGKIRDSNF